MSSSDLSYSHSVGMLASVRSPFEALIALAAGADIIDAKNPNQGALGALSADEISLIVKAVQARCPVSATTGDWPLGSPEMLNSYQSIQHTGVNYIKVGLFGVPDENALRTGLTALSLCHVQPTVTPPLPGDPSLPDSGSTHSLRHSASQDLSLEKNLMTCQEKSSQHIAVIMADQGIPLWPLSILREFGFMGVMLDTANKHLGSLRTVASQETLGLFVSHAQNLGMMVGLAGSLTQEDIPPLVALHPNYLGFRTALCGDEGRTSGLDSSRIAQVRNTLDRANTLTSS